MAASRPPSSYQAPHPPSAASAPLPPNQGQVAKRPPILSSPQDLKKRLRDLLQAKFDAYFEVLARFVSGGSAKSDLDAYLEGNLNDQQRKVHNLFVMTIFRSATSTLVQAPAPTLTSQRPHQPTFYMPRPVEHQRGRDIKSDGLSTNIRRKLSQRFKAANMSDPSDLVVAAITVGLENYLKSLLSLTTPASRVANQAHRELERETGRSTLQEDLMEVDEMATSDPHASYLQSLAGVYGRDDPMEIIAHRRDGVITADDILAVGDTQLRLMQGQHQKLRVLNFI